MADARAGLAELQLGEIAAYLALLDAVAETLAGDLASAERAVRDAEAIVSESGNRWYQAIIHVDLAHALIAQDRWQEAAAARRADRDAAGALRRRVGDQAPHGAGARGGAGGRPRARARGRARGGRGRRGDRPDRLPRQRASHAGRAALGNGQHAGSRGGRRPRACARRGEGQCRGSGGHEAALLCFARDGRLRTLVRRASAARASPVAGTRSRWARARGRSRGRVAARRSRSRRPGTACGRG